MPRGSVLYAIRFQFCLILFRHVPICFLNEAILSLFKLIPDIAVVRRSNYHYLTLATSVLPS